MEDQLAELYGSLSTVELTQLMLSIRAQISTDMAINFSIYFGYLVVAYIVGRELTRTQAAVFSIAYSVLVLAAIVQIFIDLSVINALQGILLGSDVPFGYSVFQVSVLVGLWALTVIYMCQRRRTRRS